MWRILQQDTPEDFVIATGVTTSVRDFVRMAFKEAGIKIVFTGSGIHEKGIVASCENDEYSVPAGQVVVAIDPAYFRPTEVDLLAGDATKARVKLGWTPGYNLEMLIKEMVESDIRKYCSALGRQTLTQLDY
jgi:GDPmannose 4,6-dehydratase